MRTLVCSVLLDLGFKFRLFAKNIFFESISKA